jgi:hypothetical protein
MPRVSKTPFSAAKQFKKPYRKVSVQADDTLDSILPNRWRGARWNLMHLNLCLTTL